MAKYNNSKGLRLIIVILILVFAARSISIAERHWAKDEIEYLLSKGIVSGYPDGTFKPDNPITRAEFVKIINKVIGTKGKSDVPFKDVNEKNWFYDEVAKAIKSGYVEGYGDNTFRPNKPITRQEAAKIIVTAFRLEGISLSNDSSFIDQNKIDNWAQEYVTILKNRGYIYGYADGTFRPNNPITRAESVKMITKISGEIINVAGEYSQDVAKNVLVNISDVVLKDMHIKGDLYLVEGIGDGDVILDNVIVEGTTYIRGGGADSIYINNSHLNNLVIGKVDGLVHVVLDNSKSLSIIVSMNTKLTIKKGTSIELMKIAGKSNIKIERGSEIDKIEIQSLGVEIIVEGDIKSIVANEDFRLNNQLLKKGTELSIKDGKIIIPKDSRDEEARDKVEDEEEEPIPIGYQFNVKLDKDIYEINEEITLTGIVSRNNIGLANIDITLKLGEEPIIVEQLKTDKNGKFIYKFKLPESTNPGEYELIVKANEPVNMFRRLDIKLVEKYTIEVELDKEKYTIDEAITVYGKAFEDGIGLPNIDITLRLQDEDGEETITVGQLKTDNTGGFNYSFKVPEDTELGKYKLILKANQPVNKFLELWIEIIER